MTAFLDSNIVLYALGDEPGLALAIAQRIQHRITKAVDGR